MPTLTTVEVDLATAVRRSTVHVAQSSCHSDMLDLLLHVVEYRTKHASLPLLCDGPTAVRYQASLQFCNLQILHCSSRNCFTHAPIATPSFAIPAYCTRPLRDPSYRHVSSVRHGTANHRTGDTRDVARSARSELVVQGMSQHHPDVPSALLGRVL